MYKKPTNREIQAIFNGIADQYEKISNPYVTSRRREILIHWSKGDCLEVGAGDGKLAAELAKNHNIIATDISPNMVDNIKKRKVRAVVADAEKLPFEKNSFDTVIAAELIYYLDNPANFINEADRVLKSNGLLLICFANNIAKIYDIARTLLRKIGFSQMYFDDKIQDFMSSPRLKKMLIKQGFKIEKEQKMIILPFKKLDWINRILENSPFKSLGIFTIIMAKKI